MSLLKLLNFQVIIGFAYVFMPVVVFLYELHKYRSKQEIN
jgi:hypothetical protein